MEVASLFKGIVALLSLLSLQLSVSVAVPVHCGDTETFSNPSATLKSLKSDHFMIIDSSNQELIEDDGNEESIPQPDFPGFKSSCPVTLVEDFDKKRIPRVISSASLVSNADRKLCRPVYRFVMFLQRQKKCNKNFHQNLYEIKQKRVVVAYERIQFK